MPREETIKVKVDKVEALQSLKELKATADSIKKELGSIKVGDAAKAITEQAKAAKENAKATVEQSKAIKESANANKALAQAEKELENATNARLRAQTSAQNVVTAKLRTAKEAVNLIKAQSSAEKEAANAEAAKSRAQKAAIQTQNAINKSVSSGAQYVSHYASAMKSFATQLIGFYGITTTLRKAFTEMKAMNDELVTYRKVTGATAADMQKMQSAAYSAAKQYGQSPSDFLASAATMARAGYKENSAAMAELATKTQLVGDMTADQASKFLIAVDAAYKYQGNIKQLSSVLDSANEIDNKYATTIEKISEGMTLVASVAATAEVPIEQLMAALGTMTAVTQREGTEAARGLRYILLHAMGDTTTEIEEGVTATEEGIQTLNEAVMKYGDESAKAALKAGKMINPMEKIVALQKAWKEGTLSKESLYDIGLKVAGQRQYNMFMALIQNPEMYNSMMKDIANSAGSADKEWQAMMDSWSKKLEKLKATFTELVNNTISTDFIKSLIDAGTGALEFAGNLENLATMATGAYAAIKALSTGLGNLSKNQKFGGFNIASMGIGLAITAIGAWKSAYEKNIKDLQTSAQKAVEDAIGKASTSKNLEELVDRYKKVAEDGIDKEKGELEELKTIQDELNKLVGKQGEAIDIVNGKYDDTIKKLQQMTEEQRNAALMTLQAAKAQAVAAFKQSDLNGFWNTSISNKDGYALTDITGSALYNESVNNWIANSQYFKIMEWQKGVNRLYFRKPDDAEGIISFIKEVEDFYTFLGTTGVDGGKAGEGVKSLGEEFSSFYVDLGKFVKASKDAGNAVVESQEAIDSFNKTLEKGSTTSDGSAAKAAEGLQTVASSAITLASAIDTATNAKKKFDDAMKESKADAFNDYVKAFETLQKEMDAGRVNSNAFYAAAEMLMGEEAYAATGGESAAVRKAMKKRTKGDSGSAYDAWQILSKKYYNKKTGEEIEGFGFAELLRQTKGWGEKKITDKDGNIVIPSLTPEQIASIANAWHIDSSFLMAAWNAFDQHDTKGKKQNDDLMDAKEEEKKSTEDGSDANKTLADSTTQASGAMNTATTAATNLAGALNDAADAIFGGNGKDNIEKPDSVIGGTGDDKYENTTLSDYYNTIKDINDAVNILGANLKSLEINQSTMSSIRTLTEFLYGLLEEPNFQLDIQTGDVTNQTTSKITSLEDALQAIEALKQNGVISADVAAQLKGNILQDLEKLGVDVQKYKDNPPEITVDANIDQAEEKVEELSKSVEGEHPFNVTGGVSEETKNDVSKIDGIVTALKNSYTLSVSDGNAVPADTVSSLIDLMDALGRDYTFKVSNGADVAAVEATIGKLEDAIKLVNGMASSGLISSEDADALTSGFQTIIDGLVKSIDDYNKDPKKLKVDADDKDAKDKLGELEAGPYNATIKADIDDDQAKKDIAALEAPGFKKITVSVVEAATKASLEEGNPANKSVYNRTIQSSGGSGRPNVLMKQAVGTRNHPGGYSIVNDGSGPELIIDNGQAFIAGNGKPTVVGLNKGAKVFTASETRNILGGGSIPAYASGTTGGSGLSFSNTTTKKPSIKVTNQKIKKTAKKSSSSKKSAAKEDKESFSNLASMVDYIIGRIGTALDEQLDVIDAQIEALNKAREAAEEQNKLEELQKNVTDALNERTVRYLGEDGKWHWMADQKNVQQAQKALKEYQDELAFNAQVNELENQKKSLQDAYKEFTKTWSGIKDAVNTPTGSLSDLINQVLANGTAQQKAGAKAVSGTLISGITESVYTKNYDEALSAIAKATAGNPVMPGSGAASLASLIATAGAGATEASITEALKTAASPSASITGSNGSLAAGNNTNINYFIDGIKLGEGMENMPLSSIMKNLSVYTNTGVN